MRNHQWLKKFRHLWNLTFFNYIFLKIQKMNLFQKTNITKTRAMSQTKTTVKMTTAIISFLEMMKSSNLHIIFSKRKERENAHQNSQEHVIQPPRQARTKKMELRQQ